MKRLVEETFFITAKQAGKALPRTAAQGTIALEMAGRYSQQIMLVSTPGNAGGYVRWFLCPGCKKRVGKLWLPSGEAVFLCRKCHDLGYRAQQLRAFRNPAGTDIAATKQRRKTTREEILAAVRKLIRARRKEGLVPAWQ